MRLLLLTFCIALLSFPLFSQEVLWSMNYGGSNHDLIYKIKNLNSDTFIGVGFSLSDDLDLANNYGGWDGWILSFNCDGELLWSKNYGGSESEVFHDFEIVDDGIIVVGASSSNDIDVPENKGQEDIWILKTDFNGNIIWSKTFGSVFREIPIDMLIEDDGSIIILAQSRYKGGDVPNTFGGTDLWFLHLDQNGTIINSRVYGGMEDEGGYSTFNLGGHSNKGKIVKVKGGYLIVTASESSDGFFSENQGGYDNWMLEIDHDGGIKRSVNFGGEANDYLTNMYKKDQNLFLFGNSASNSSFYSSSTSKGSEDFWVYEYNPWGEISPIRNFGGSLGETGKDKVTFTDNTHTFVGTSTSNNGDLPSNYGWRDGWVLRLDENFNVGWSKNYGGSSVDVLFSISQCYNYNVVASGITYSEDYDLDNHYGGGDGWIIKIKDTCITKRHEIDTFLCSGSYLLFQKDTIDQGGIYTDTFTAKTGCDSVLIWNVEEYGTQIDTTIQSSFCKTYSLPSGEVITNAGTYFDTLISSLGCDSIIKYELQKENFLMDTVRLSACEVYEHSDGQVVDVNSSIHDTVFNNQECDSIRTYAINILEQDTAFLELKVKTGQAVSFKDTFYTKAGTYLYRQNNEDACDSIFIVKVMESRVCDLYVPNAFSPNRDGVNDIFLATTACQIFNFKAQIFNRWGQLITESRQPHIIWDGGDHPSGVYIYFITYEYKNASGRVAKKLTGSVALVR